MAGCVNELLVERGRGIGVGKKKDRMRKLMRIVVKGREEDDDEWWWGGRGNNSALIECIALNRSDNKLSLRLRVVRVLTRSA